MKQPFEQIVAQHGTTVLRVCRAVLGAADADDAWSETFLAAMRACPDLPADANVEAWLVTIAHRKAVDVLRATSRRPTPVDAVPEQVPPGGPLRRRLRWLRRRPRGQATAPGARGRGEVTSAR